MDEENDPISDSLISAMMLMELAWGAGVGQYAHDLRSSAYHLVQQALQLHIGEEAEPLPLFTRETLAKIHADAAIFEASRSAAKIHRQPSSDQT